MQLIFSTLILKKKNAYFRVVFLQVQVLTNFSSSFKFMWQKKMYLSKTVLFHKKLSKIYKFLHFWWYVLQVAESKYVKLHCAQGLK